MVTHKFVAPLILRVRWLNTGMRIIGKEKLVKDTHNIKLYLITHYITMFTDIPSLENYIFTDNKEDFLKKLVQGTDQYYCYTFTNLLNQKGASLSS